MISIQVTGYESDTLIILKLVNRTQIWSVASNFCKDIGYSVSMLVLRCRNRSIRRAIFHLFCLAVICFYLLLNTRFVFLHLICSPNEFAAIRNWRERGSWIRMWQAKFSIIKQHSQHLTDCLVEHNAMTDLNLRIIYDDILLVNIILSPSAFPWLHKKEVISEAENVITISWRI